MATLAASIRTFSNEPLENFRRAESANAMRAAIDKVRSELGREHELVIGGRRIRTADKIRSVNPAHSDQVVGIHQKAGHEQIEPAMQAALQAFESWKNVPVEERAALIFRLADSDRFDAVKSTIESDPRLTLEAKRETRFYADQSESLAKFISYLGTTISVIFSFGANIGAMITMYASVASRTSEIGTLRALGFPRTAILVAFLVEALTLGLLGGVIGIVAASFMQAMSISTMNFQTFAEIAFSFTMTPGIVAASLAFALAMGFVGGFLPAARAARMKIVDALRAA